MPKPTEDSKIVENLRENGPTLAKELPGSSLKIREEYVRRFSLLYGRMICYLPDEHTKEEVLREWKAQNESTVEEKSSRTLQIKLGKNYSDEWVEAGNEVFGPFSNHMCDDMDLEMDLGGECPLCEEEYQTTLRRHLPCDS